MAYRFSVLRFVPDPGRGEFVNIGAIAGDDDSGDWELRLVQNLRRAKAIDEKGALEAALSFAARVEDHVDALELVPGTAVEAMSTELLERWSGEMRNIVQVTDPAPLVAESAELALDLVFSELLLDPAAQRFRFEKKHRAVGSTRRAYRDNGVPDEAVASRASITSGPYEASFDFAVINGHVVQLAHCWSFQLPNQVELAEQVKAWAWVVQELRSSGGLLRLSDRDVAISADGELEIAAVYVPPADGQEQSHAFDEAQAAWKETKTWPVTADDADEVGEHAARLLAVA